MNKFLKCTPIIYISTYFVNIFYFKNGLTLSKILYINIYILFIFYIIC